MTPPFEVVVLGASGTYPQPGMAATGYLVRQGEYCIWVDCGSGTFANLQRHMDFHDLNAIVVSHLHIDHIVDLYSLYYALRYGAGSRGPRGLEILAPAGSEGHLEQLVSPNSVDGFGGFFQFRPVRDGDKISLEPFTISFRRTIHPIECLAMRVESGGRTLVYTSDTGWSDVLIEFARGADLLIAEASLHRMTPAMREVHMTAEEAGVLAELAGAGRLALTHIVPGLDPQVSLRQAASKFSGETMLARDNEVIPV
ncbi:MAG: MBL fold metallo-hydrolase [Actinomycetota bacterium]